MPNKKTTSNKTKQVGVKKETKKVETAKKTEITKKVEKNKPIKENKNSKQKKVKNSHAKFFKFYELFDKYRMTIYGVIGGVLITILVAILMWPKRIAKLENGLEPVASIDGYTITAEDLYTKMKEKYSVEYLIESIDAHILEEKYPENEEMLSEIENTANSYYNTYEQYYGISKEQFLSENGFGTESVFLEYLKLPYRRSKYAEDYVKSLITDKEINNYYEDKVYGDIDTKHILVATSDSSTEEEKEAAKALANEIIDKLNNGSTFDEVKEEYKDSITYEELGYKSYNANLESSYMNEMKKLENNSYSKEPVETSYGYHIVYRIDQKEKPALEDIKDEIIEALASDKMANDTKLAYKALENMRKEANLTFVDTDLEGKYNTYLDNIAKQQ